jgi:hypothetical protein
MSTRKRNTKGAFAPEVVAIYRELCQLEPIRRGCDQGMPDANCKLPWTESCAECTRHRELGDKLYFALSLKPWQYPFSYTPQEPAGLNEPELTAWWARELSAALAVALADK